MEHIGKPKQEDYLIKTDIRIYLYSQQSQFNKTKMERSGLYFFKFATSKGLLL